MTEEKDREQDGEHIQKAMSQCGYPKWTNKKVKAQIRKREKEDKRKKGNHTKTVNSEDYSPSLMSKASQKV